MNMFAPDFLPKEVKFKGKHWVYRNKKYKTKLEALVRWYRDQVKSGNI